MKLLRATYNARPLTCQLLFVLALTALSFTVAALVIYSARIFWFSS